MLHFRDVDVLDFFLVLMQFPDPLPAVRTVILQYRGSSVRVLVCWSMWFLIVSAEVADVILMIRGTYIWFCVKCRLLIQDMVLQ